MPAKRKRSEKQHEVKKPTHVRALKAYFSRHSLDMRSGCTAVASETAADRRTCWLVRRVDVWNSLLENIGIEIRESRPGRLSLFTFARCNPSDSDYATVCITLLAELLATHRCIYYVDLSYPGHLFNLRLKVLEHLTPNAAIDQFYVDGKLMMKEEASSRLKELTLSETGLKVADCIELFKALEGSTVEHLKLEFNTVGIRGAHQFALLLQNNTTLRSVSLQRTKIQAKGAIAIASALQTNMTLAALRVASNNIGPRGAQALADALKVNNSLLVLDVRDNSVCSAGAKALADMLTVNTKLEELHVCGNTINDDGIVAIAESLLKNQTVKTLSLFANSFGENSVKALGKLVAANKTLSRLNTTLESSQDSGTPLDELAEALAANTVIRGIQLFVWGGHAMQRLSHMIRLSQTLQYLCVCTCGPGVDVLAEALEQNQSVREVELNCYINPEEGAALGHLFQVSNTLQALSITKKVHSAGLVNLFNGLAENTSAWWVNVTTGGTVRPTVCRAIAGMLDKNRTLSCLTMGRATADEAGLQLISRALEGNQKLQMLCMTYTATSSAACAIREKLRRNLGRMMQAIGFTLANRVDRAGAEAFELHKDGIFFQQELVKMTKNSPGPSADGLIKQTERFIRDNYFRITQVVQSQVVCVRPPRKRKRTTYIDRLDEYCMRAILQFLRVTDVRARR
ncbi:hypothetical protein HPB48_022454 [Haemaphysalis longicornis]|uniref:Ran GTPase-activating protein n=1 Tax=Haemaphysalis longicornis TaxID=44386 RepID=A0A9J6G2R0_HAELO|nr:hypothetical protein HPB48_022454 [Haemaphysalis longicornis]